MATKMATVEKAQELIEKLRSVSWNAAVQDMEDLKSFSKAQGASEANDLTHWDIGFWSERLRESKYDINEEELRPYFSLPKVMNSLFNLAKTLFAIDIDPADGLAPVWNSDVKFYRVKDSSGSPIAYFYFDPYSRPAEKRGGAWMDEVVARSRVMSRNGTSARLPIAHMVCNQTPPVGNKPSLMTFREVETVFHEFGHALQHMLTKQDEGLVAGIRGVEWDAVELPSQFMENWCYHRDTLMGIAKHYETGESLPEEVFQKLLAARTFRAGTLSLRQLRCAPVDLELHTKYVPGGQESIYDVDRRVAERTQVNLPFPEDRFLCGFSHIFGGGYAAGYYSYKWAEVLSADAFSAFEDAGLDDNKAVTETGKKFRETILALGGGKDPLEVFVAFRGREPSPDALLRHNGLLAATA
jgi:oligopeptidase A